MRNFTMEQDSNKRDTGVIPPSDTVYNLVLAANTEKIVTIPTGANIAVFSGTGNFYCRFDATVSVPAVDIVDGTGGELNPVSRVVTRMTTIHLISSAIMIVTISFYNTPFPIA